MQNFFQSDQSNARQIIQSFVNSGKQNFLVSYRGRYIVAPLKKIAYFHIKNDATLIHTFSDEEYVINQSLEAVSGQLPHGKFYRLNRQYLVSFDAVKEVEHFFSRKLLVHLKVNVQSELLINKNKTTEFLNWLENK